MNATTTTTATNPYYVPEDDDTWAVGTTELQIELNFNDDDDAPSSDMDRVPVVGIVLLVVFASAIIGAIIFYLSYRQERGEVEAKEAQSASLRQTPEIERGLKLKKWENLKEMMNDELTHHDSGSSDNDQSSSDGEKDDDDMVSVHSEESGSNSSIRSAFMDDPKFVRLQQKPRCVLCSKFFTEEDTVTESWEPSCTHNFHKECLVKWLQKKDGCPVCKRAYVVGLKVEEA